MADCKDGEGVRAINPGAGEKSFRSQVSSWARRNERRVSVKKVAKGEYILTLREGADNPIKRPGRPGYWPELWNLKEGQVVEISVPHNRYETLRRAVKRIMNRCHWQMWFSRVRAGENGATWYEVMRAQHLGPPIPDDGTDPL